MLQTSGLSSMDRVFPATWNNLKEQTSFVGLWSLGTKKCRRGASDLEHKLLIHQSILFTLLLCKMHLQLKGTFHITSCGKSIVGSPHFFYIKYDLKTALKPERFRRRKKSQRKFSLIFVFPLTDTKIWFMSRNWWSQRRKNWFVKTNPCTHVHLKMIVTNFEKTESAVTATDYCCEHLVLSALSDEEELFLAT